jgi:hypothetical protein
MPKLFSVAAASIIVCFIGLIFTCAVYVRFCRGRQNQHANRKISSLRLREGTYSLTFDVTTGGTADKQAAHRNSTSDEGHASVKAAADSLSRATLSATTFLSEHLSSCNFSLQRHQCEAVAVSPSNTSCIHGHRSNQAGLGHQMSEVLMWLRFAHLEKASFLYEPFSSAVSVEHHNSYEFSNAFFGLVAAVRSMHGTVIDDNASKLAHTCEKVKKPNWMDCGIPGSDVSCFVSLRMTRLFYEYAPCLRQSALCYGDWVDQARSLPFNPTLVNVAWHIRIGSGGYYYTTSSNFYREVLGFMAPFLSGRKSVQYLIGGNGWEKEHGDFVAHIQSIISGLKLSSLSQVVPVFLSVKDSLLYMMSADITVSTSSSFSDIAALFSSFPVYISPPPKHGVGANMLEYLPDGVYVDGWTWKSNKQYIVNPYRLSELSSLEAVNNTLHQRLASRFPAQATPRNSRVM